MLIEYLPDSSLKAWRYIKKERKDIGNHRREAMLAI